MSRRRLTSLLIAVLLLSEALTAPSTWAAAPRPAPATSDNPAGLLPGSGQVAEGTPSADLRRPPAPLGDHRPRFVRQSGKNCAFASAAMLIDKWSDGASRPSQERLRRASRVPVSKGVSFAELSRAVARGTDFELRYSPGGGDPMTWSELLGRLERGGGAVLGGAYSRLPRHYQRHARGFASGGAAASGHAVYIERYEARRGGGRVWLMDPLAKGDSYTGEWISVKSLRRFAWVNSRGLVSAAATPEPPPLAGYAFGQPEVDEWLVAGDQLTVRLPLTVSPGWRRPDGLALQLRWQLVEAEQPAAPEAMPATDPVELAAAAALSPRGLSAVQPPDEGDPGAMKADPGSSLPRLDFTDGRLQARLQAPDVPGEYLLHAQLRNRNGSALDGAEKVAFKPLTVRLRGDLAVQYELIAPMAETLAGPHTLVRLSVTNRGRLDWLDEDGMQLVASWQTSLGELTGMTTGISMGSAESEILVLPLDVPTMVSSGSLYVELLTGDGLPVSDPLVIPFVFSGDAPAG